MAFKYDHDHDRAVNADTGETVERTAAYTDIAGAAVYRYSSAGRTLEIYVSSRTEPAASGQRDVTVAAVIDEGALWSAYLGAYPERASENDTRAQFDAFKATISEAVFEISSCGGHLLKFSPRFHVEFAQSLESA